MIQSRWRREFVSMAERDTLRAIEGIARGFSRYDPGEFGACRDVDAKAVQIYLCKRALGWGLGRIGRRFDGGVSLQHAMKLYPRGRRLVAAAVAAGTITPETVARLLPRHAYF